MNLNQEPRCPGDIILDHSPNDRTQLFIRACRLPRKALAVYLVLWQQAKLRRSDTILLTSALLAQYGLSRNHKGTALRALESAGLVKTIRRPRRNPEVTLLHPLTAAQGRKEEPM